MKKYNKIIFAAVLFCTLFLTACAPTNNSIKRMQKLEENVSNPSSKEEIVEAIKKYEARAMDLTLAESQVGMWYKLLGTRYLEAGMYTKAFEAFQKAVYYYPDNANLYYYIAVSAGFIANSQLDYEAKGELDAATKKMNYLKLAESAFLQALEINPRYYRAMYSLGVLYVFELDQCDKAIPYIETYLDTQKRDTEGMFLLANAYYQTYQFDKAIMLYDKIISINPDSQTTEKAKANKKVVYDAQFSN